MNRYNKPIKRTWKGILSQALVIAVITFITVWFLPGADRSTFLVDVGRPWPHSRLRAPFDFYIFKSEAELQHERDSILQTYSPYFEQSLETMERQLAAFRTAARSQKPGEMPRAYLDFVEEQLRNIYQQGIIDVDNLKVLQLQNTQSVILYHGTEAITVPVSQLYTEKSAYEHLFSAAEAEHLDRKRLQGLNLNGYIKVNLTYDEEKSDQLRDGMERLISPSSGMVYAGQNIIDRGDIVTEETYQILSSYNRTLQERSKNTINADNQVVFGQIMYVLAIFLSLTIYFNLFRKDYIGSVRSVSLLVALILTFSILTSLIIEHTLLSVYVIPYAMLPVFVRIFMDSRTAYFVHVITIMLCAISLSYPFEFIATQLVAGLVAIYSLREMSQRSQIIRTAILVTLSALFMYLSIEMVHGHTFFGEDALMRIDWQIYVHLLIAGVLLLFAYPLMALLERMFGFISDVTLVELSNVNSELLRQLSETAPGTFQHSMQVANLAAEVANQLGVKAQLVRTGALYHDIGKMKNPEFFTENQLGGINPHRNLSNRESAAIILRHVKDGEELADRYRLPRLVREFITTHHGRGIAKFFYINEKNAHPNEEVNPEDYRYQGENPHTVEQAILMMTDAVEAAARSLQEYTEESIGQLVDKMIDSQVAEGFFQRCPITFQDISTAKEVLKGKLRTIYHTRVTYPTLNTENQEDSQSGSTSK